MVVRSLTRTRPPWPSCGRRAPATQSSPSAPTATLTGAEVRDLARRIAAAVRGHGAGVSDRVAILLPRGARLLPAILGVWSAGASYVPLDPIYPAQRLATMLGDAGAAAIVVDSGVEGAPVPPPAAGPIPVVDLATLAAPERAEPVPDLPPSAAA